MYNSGHVVYKAFNTPLLHGLIEGLGPLFLRNSKELSVSDESFLRQSQAILCQRSTGTFLKIGATSKDTQGD